MKAKKPAPKKRKAKKVMECKTHIAPAPLPELVACRPAPAVRMMDGGDPRGSIIRPPISGETDE